ncbi:MAG: CHASE domain-containing protein [Candidatus Firestonebacteria bacterium]
MNTVKFSKFDLVANADKKGSLLSNNQNKLFSAFILAAIVAGSLFVWWTIHQYDRKLRSDNLLQARLIAGALDLDGIKALKGLGSDLASPNYLRIKKQLALVRGSTANCRFLYLMGRHPDGTVFFYADSEPKGSKDESPAGQAYGEVSPGDIRAFETKKDISVGPVSDRWGTYISSLIPLIDRQGNLVAVFGMDIDIAAWRRDLLGAGVIPVSLTLLLLLVISSGYYLLSRRAGFGYAYKGALRYVEVALICSVGIILTLSAAWTAHQSEKQSQQEVFLQLANDKISLLTQRLNSLEKIELEGLAHYIENTNSIHSKDFFVYTSYLTQDPTVQTWEWIPAVPHRDRAKYENEARLSGLADYSFWEKDASGRKIPAAIRETYYPAYLVNPLKGNYPALGYDRGSEQVRRAALEEAISSGLSAATDAIVLVQETMTRYGMLLYRPVFTEDKKKVRGFALAVLKLETFLRRSTGITSATKNPVLNMNLFQAFPNTQPVLVASTSGLVYRQGQDNKRAFNQGTLYISQPLFVFDKVFILKALPSSGFYLTHPKKAGGLTLLVGFTLTGFLLFLVRLTISRESELGQQVSERTIMLHQTRARQAATLRSIGDGVISTDTNGCIVSINSVAEKLTGWVWTEAQGRPISDIFNIFDSATKAKAKNPVELTLKKGITVGLSANTLLRSLDGSEYQIAESCAPIRDYGGAVTGAVLVFRDVTSEHEQRKQIEFSQEMLKSERALLRGLLDSIPDSVFFKNREGAYLGCNPEFGKFVGKTEKDIIGKTDYDLFSAEIADAYSKQDDLAMKEDLPLRYEEWVTYPDGKKVMLDKVKTSLKDSYGRVVGLLGVGHDITGRKKAEMEIAKAIETKSEFISMVSHELRTPLAVIMEAVKIVSDGSCGVVNDEQKDYLGVAVRNIDRLGRLINDVLFVQKLESGMMKFKIQENNLNEAVAGVLEAMRPLAQKSGLVLEALIGDNIPRIKFDSDKIIQVLTNLINNALKFTEKGKITVITEKEDKNVKVSIVDTGLGIKPEDINKLFGKFEQILTGNERKAGGTGLGLAISKEIIVNHKGKIWVESEWGKGTKFIFTLPVD